jgi:hypothetical protein
MIISNLLNIHGESGMNMNFNDHTITWNTDNALMKDSNTLASAEALIEVYMSANEPKTLRDEYSRPIKTLDADNKQASARLDDFIKTCENVHVEEQHQLKILLQNYEDLFDRTLGEFNMEY